MINTKKASQLNDVLTEYIKKFSNVFTPVITDEVIPTARRANLQKKLTAERLVYFPIYLKFMKDLCPII